MQTINLEIFESIEEVRFCWQNQNSDEFYQTIFNEEKLFIFEILFNNVRDNGKSADNNQ